MSADPTGYRHIIGSAAVTAEIAQVGAALRALRIGEVDVVPRYPDDRPTPAASGLVLVPWPNRVRDGRWSQRGEERRLTITEPALGNASHGLLRFAAYRLADSAPDTVTLAADVYPQTGYPFHLDTRVTYTIAEGGLDVRHVLTNVGDAAAPVALGTHPYLCISDVETADLRIEVDAATWFRTDERSLPVAEEPLDEAHDLRRPRRVGDLDLDTAYGSLGRDGNGRVRGILRAPDGRRLELWAGEGFEYLQVFTTDRYPGHDLAVAIEPMTAPADALNSGRDLRWLEPGERWELTWGVSLHD